MILFLLTIALLIIIVAGIHEADTHRHGDRI